MQRRPGMGEVSGAGPCCLCSSGRAGDGQREPEMEETVCGIGGINGKHNLWVHPREMLPWDIACSNSLFPIFS